MLGAQERDREKQRQHDSGRERNRMLFVGAVIVAVVSFAGWGLYLNKDAVVRDVVQMVLSAVVGALGGYGYAKHAETARKKEAEADG
jgi:cation transport ATPase